MNVVSPIASFIYFVLFLYLLVVWARFLLDLARSFARNWRPRGALLVIAEVVFSLTDPPIRAIRRVVPPVRIGGLALDFALSIVLLALFILLYIVALFR